MKQMQRMTQISFCDIFIFDSQNQILFIIVLCYYKTLNFDVAMVLQ